MLFLLENTREDQEFWVCKWLGRGYIHKSPSRKSQQLAISVVRMHNPEGQIKMAVELDALVQVKMENDVEYTTNLALFTNVSNSDELRQLIVQGKIEAALLNACMVR